MIKIRINKIMPFNIEDIYKVLIDVEKYPSFLPFIDEVKINQPEKNRFSALMKFSYSIYKSEFTSRIIFNENKKIQVESNDGYIKSLSQIWELKDETKTKDSTLVEFSLDLELNNWITEKIAGKIIKELSNIYISSFEKRIKSILMKN